MENPITYIRVLHITVIQTRMQDLILTNEGNWRPTMNAIGNEVFKEHSLHVYNKFHNNKFHKWHVANETNTYKMRCHRNAINYE